MTLVPLTVRKETKKGNSIENPIAKLQGSKTKAAMWRKKGVGLLQGDDRKGNKIGGGCHQKRKKKSQESFGYCKAKKK